jgi:hypothetical protein
MPFLDRIDINEVPRADYDKLTAERLGETSERSNVGHGGRGKSLRSTILRRGGNIVRSRCDDQGRCRRRSDPVLEQHTCWTRPHALPRIIRISHYLLGHEIAMRTPGLRSGRAFPLSVTPSHSTPREHTAAQAWTGGTPDRRERASGRARRGKNESSLNAEQQPGQDDLKRSH